ncbi:Ran GTPase-activating protein (RanGAP) involved in mRNA processing and transport [Legionella busanensis]|uniref:Ran GTPase-activating protein (RanGAP) involved in mRNA processing and transport n=1 Tax=Legionella busanensis TaxID=190655 RepID=A0A378KD46_9GAMM|nr:hypothetical protein [Legionella busanensis]STX81431.1 Ran GTPase-activating protein (RanGAP) involved in mRNA processing and transport [Legionella busanensis]
MLRYLNNTQTLDIKIPSSVTREQFFLELSNSKATAIDVDLRFDSWEKQKDFFNDLFVTLNQNKNIRRLNYLSRISSKELFSVLADGIGQSKFLTDIELYCEIDWSKLAVALQNNSVLSKLKLACCNLGYLGAQKLASGILDNTSLTELNLTHTGITNDDSVVIVQACISQGKISALSLRSNTIENTQLAKIIELLATNKSLKYIDLQFTNIGITEIETICKLVSKEHFTEGFVFDLRNNHITNEGAQIILEKIKSGNYPPNLYIDLRKNKIDDDLLNEITGQLEINKAALACTAIQQGARQEECLISNLPQKILEDIYQFSFPFPKRKEEMQNFSKNINKVCSNSPLTFFNDSLKTGKLSELEKNEEGTLSILPNNF